MYFGAEVAGNMHLWRQKFPDGAPQQITFGSTQEEGVAPAPDGRSLITSVGMRHSAIWMHDAAGDRAISSEGYASAPRLSRDGTHVFYLLERGPVVPSSGTSGELRWVDLASGKTDSLLPGVSVIDYDISSDGRDVAYTASDSSGESQIWLAALDRRSPARQIARSADQVSFGASGELVFRLKEEKTNFLYRINKDGTGREQITATPSLVKLGVSPDGEWVGAVVALAPDESSEALDVPFETVAVPVHGGAVKRLCGRWCSASWSSDGRFFYVVLNESTVNVVNTPALSGITFAIPVPAGKMLPDLPAGGLRSPLEAAPPPGTKVISEGVVSPGLDPSTYAFQRTELRGNLFRIPLH